MPGQNVDLYRRLAQTHTADNPRPPAVGLPTLPCDFGDCRRRAAITFLFQRPPECGHGPTPMRTSYCQQHADAYHERLVCSVCDAPMTLTPPIHLAG